MTAKPVYVFDTNVLVDALMFPRSFGRRAFDLSAQTGTIVYSRETFAELAEVIYREKFDRFITDTEREIFLRFFARECELVIPTETVTICRDPKDDKFLDLAVAANADMIISRDDDLLTLSPFRDFEILEPKSLVER